MSTQNAQATAAPAPDWYGQGSHCWVLTLSLPSRMSVTQYGTVTPAPGATRYDTFLNIREYVVAENPDLSDGNVVFFALDPNQL
ncbi:hypothetical protein [Streptomyces sp. XY511]|uniref:hypothetical protein n=1 Tax=Streptomyces sp. XY511 TaxID=1519480 RepID=UPI0006B0127A|nr:hypothetical protein [Streptomyces sp. XY511]